MKRKHLFRLSKPTHKELFSTSVYNFFDHVPNHIRVPLLEDMELNSLSI